MKVVIAIDSFKGSMTSLEAGQAAAKGVRAAAPGAEILVRPLADGGEGTVEAMVLGSDGTYRSVTVSGPLGDPVECTYGFLGDGKTAVMEMAAASGITLIPPEARDPKRTTTYGFGEAVRHAVLAGARRFVIGIGGSATNDAGAGMLQALGFDLLDEDGRPVERGAQGLARIAKIGTDHVLPELAACTFRVACDVNNPLCGPRGASAVFGPQKGASPETVELLDSWLAHFAQTAKEAFPDADPDLPGSGAAGGLGFALRTFLHAELASGVDIVLEETDFAKAAAGADLVITGEGRLDGQTAMGKAPVGVARRAREGGAAVIALAGSVTEDASACNEAGIDAYFPILRGVCTLEEAMENETARRNMTGTAEQAVRLFLAGRAG